MLNFTPSCIPETEEYSIDIMNIELGASSGVEDLTNLQFIYTLAEHYDARVCLVPARTDEAKSHNSELQRSSITREEKAARFMFTVLLQRPV